MLSIMSRNVLFLNKNRAWASFGKPSRCPVYEICTSHHVQLFCYKNLLFTEEKSNVRLQAEVWHSIFDTHFQQKHWKTCKQQQVMSQSRICLQTSLRHVYVCRHLRITHVWNLQKRIVKRTLFDSGRVRDKLNYERRLHLKILSNILHGLWRPRWVTRCRKMSVWEVVSPIPEHKSRTIISSGTREARPHWF